MKTLPWWGWALLVMAIVAAPLLWAVGERGSAMGINISFLIGYFLGLGAGRKES